MYLRRSTRKRNKPDLYYPGFSFQSSNRFPHIKSQPDNDNYSNNSRYPPEQHRNRSRDMDSYSENRNNTNFSGTRKRKSSNYIYDNRERDRRPVHSGYYLQRYGSNSSSHSRPSPRRKSFIRPLSNSSFISSQLTNYTSSPASTVSVNSNSSIYYPVKRKRVYYSPSDRHQHRHSLKKYYPSYSNYSSRSSKTMSHSSSSSVCTSHSRSSKHYNHSAYDDKDGHYKVVPNTEFTSRYIIKELLGQGTFGKVVRAYDKETKSEYAIKIIRAIKKYRDASQIEIRVLKTIKDRDPGNLRNCIHLVDCFDYRRHICMVFELLDQSVFDFLKENGFHPFPIKHIQHFAYQLLTSVEFIHSLKLIHTDLKPENIMIVNNESNLVSTDDKSKKKKKIKVLRSTEIQLIDFGSATFDDEYHSSVVSTRHYRAPEIILNLGWSYPCDIWSIGCILIEFFTGAALFQTHDNLEHLAMMEKVLGPIPNHLRVRNEETKDIFLPNGDLNYPNERTTADSRKYVKSIKCLNKIIPPTNKFYKLFLDLVEKLLIYDPKKRITAHEAKKHEFFKYNPDDEEPESSSK